MSNKSNEFLKAIRAGKQQIGLWLNLANPMTAEVVAGAGFDWVLIDMEHSPNDIQSVLAQLQVLAAYGTTAMVRPEWNDPVLVKRLLDLGTPNLLFPMIQSLAEARNAVCATRYPPQGIRGVSGTTRANGFGRRPDYHSRSAEETGVLVQVETRSAIRLAQEIGAIEGVDGVFFGPADIAADMGLLGQPLHSDVWAAIRPAAKRLIDAGVPVGTLVGDATFAKSLLADGFTFVACGVDASLLARSADALLQAMRS